MLTCHLYPSTSQGTRRQCPCLPWGVVHEEVISLFWDRISGIQHWLEAIKEKSHTKNLKKIPLETLPLEHSNSMSMSSTIHYPPTPPKKNLLQGHWKTYISFFALVARKLRQIQSLVTTSVSLLAPCRMILVFPLHNLWTFSALANVDIGHCLFCRILQVLFESGGWER